MSRVYLHLDVDVLDSRAAPSNEFGGEDGLPVETVRDVVSLVATRFTVAALGVGSYDPAVDEERRTPAVVAELIRLVVDSMGSR